MIEGAKRIAVTGGPGSGKTTVLEFLGNTLSEKVWLVKEASTYLTNSLPQGVEYRRDERVSFQSLIYYWQRTREDSAALQARGRLILCDRGTLDGATYWPGGPQQFFGAVRTTHEEELSRYYAVIHLEVANKAAYEQFLYTNSCRHEPWEQAKKLCDMAKSLWSKHPRFESVRSQVDFNKKQEEVAGLVAAFLK